MAEGQPESETPEPGRIGDPWVTFSETLISRLDRVEKELAELSTGQLNEVLAVVRRIEAAVGNGGQPNGNGQGAQESADQLDRIEEALVSMLDQLDRIEQLLLRGLGGPPLNE